MTPEYTAMCTMNGERRFSPRDAVNAVPGSGRQGLDSFFPRLRGEFPVHWVAAFVAGPGGRITAP